MSDRATIVLLRYLPMRSIVLMLLIGILLAPSPRAAVRLDETSSGYHTLTLFNDSPGDRWSIAASRTAVALSADNLGVDWRLDLRHTYPSGDLRFGKYDGARTIASSAADERFLGRIGPPPPAIDLTLAAHLWQRRVALDTEYRFRPTGDNDWSVGVATSPIELLTLSVRRGWLQPDPGPVELYYEYDNNGTAARAGGRLWWSSPAWFTEVAAEIAPLPRLRFHSRVRDFDLIPSPPSFNSEPSGLYRACLDGFAYDTRVGAAWTAPRHWSLDYSYRHVRLDSRLQAYDGGVPWAYFGIVRADLHQHSLTVEHRIGRLTLQSGSGDAAFQGVMKLRPFLEGLYRLLGERRQVIATGAAEWKHAALQAPMLSRSHMALDVAVDWLRVEPDIEWVTWRPVLGVTMDDLRSGQWDLCRADLIRLSLLPSLRLGPVAFEFDISQWLPLSIKETASDSADSGGGGEAGASPEPQTDGLWSGFSFAARLLLLR